MAQSAANTPESKSGPEQYQVVARRYRPQTFSELIGQEELALPPVTLRTRAVWWTLPGRLNGGTSFDATRSIAVPRRRRDRSTCSTMLAPPITLNRFHHPPAPRQD